MKPFYVFLGLLIAVVAVSQVSTVKVNTDNGGNTAAIHIVGTTNQTENYVTIIDGTKTVFRIDSKGQFGVQTNVAPTNTASVKFWLPVTVVGSGSTFRIPIYQ